MERETIDKAKNVNFPSYLEVIIGARPGSRSRDGSIMYYSPFREESSASMHVTFEDGIWKWFDHGSSRGGGDAIDFVLLYRGVSFKDAVKELLSFNGESLNVAIDRTYSIKKQATEYKRTKDMKNIAKMIRGKKFFARLPQNDNSVRKYFQDRGLMYYQEMGCRIYTSFKDHCNFVVIPLPNIENLRGVELREMCSVEKELQVGSDKKRKNFGTKTLWVLKRDLSKMLITESILDALAGELVIGDPTMTLVSLNGVGQVSQLEDLFSVIRPDEVILCTDNDFPGQDARMIAEQIMKEKNIRYSIYETKEKDLFREFQLKNNKGEEKCKEQLTEKLESQIML